jgi:hypothetical protein
MALRRLSAKESERMRKRLHPLNPADVEMAFARPDPEVMTRYLRETYPEDPRAQDLADMLDPRSSSAWRLVPQHRDKALLRFSTMMEQSRLFHEVEAREEALSAQRPLRHGDCKRIIGEVAKQSKIADRTVREAHAKVKKWKRRLEFQFGEHELSSPPALAVGEVRWF